MTRYSRDTLASNLSYVETICREKMRNAAELGREDLAEYWKKEIEDLEKLSQELVEEKII